MTNITLSNLSQMYYENIAFAIHNISTALDLSLKMSMRCWLIDYIKYKLATDMKNGAVSFHENMPKHFKRLSGL